MRDHAIFGATVIALVLTGCTGAASAPPAAGTAKVADAVKADVSQLVAHFNQHNAEAAVSHDAEGFVGMFHGMPNVVGRDADLAITRQQLTDPLAKITVHDETVDVAASGDMAVVRATYDFAFTDPATKKPATDHGNWLLGYKKQPDGSMKLAWSVVSDTGAAAPPSS